MPVTRPGRTSGDMTRALSSARPGKAWRASANAPRVPTTPDTAVVAAASPRLSQNDATKSGYSLMSRYHRSDSRRGGNWRNAASPKDTITTTRMGASRKA